MQQFVFWPSDQLGKIDMNSVVLTGWQQTTGPSGACGVNRTLDIRMPFKLVPIA